MKKKLLTLVLAGVMVVGCSMPAFAAEAIFIGGTDTYKAGEAAAGDGWAWDGADDMTMNGYNGGYIQANGKLVITQTGENTVNSGEKASYGILVMPGKNEDAELTITGDGTLNVDVEGEFACNGIYIQNGDVNIEDTTVNVTVKNTADGAMDARGIAAANGDINIDNSEVSVSVSAVSEKAEATGITAMGKVKDANINIKNSNVSAEADDAAIIAIGDAGGKINLENCKLKDPDQKVLDIDIPAEGGNRLGQVIGTGEGKITTKEALRERAAKKVEIIADNLGKSLKDSAGKKVGSPKTADTSNVLLWSMMSLICAAAIGTAALKSRKAR